MIVNAVGLSYSNPFDIARIAGSSARERQSPQSQQATDRSSERVIQGEVIGRAPLRNQPIQLTSDSLSSRQYKSPDSGLAFSARQAVNTYIGQQIDGDRIDREDGSDQIVDVYV